MKKVVLILVVVFIVSTPAFAGISLDLGLSALGNAAVSPTRVLGGEVGIGITLYDYRALVQIIGGFFVPPLGEAYSDPAGVLSVGILFSPIQYLYFGFRTGMITPIEDSEDWLNYGSMVIRVQSPGKGFHFYGESEISFTGIFNRFSMGMNVTF